MNEATQSAAEHAALTEEARSAQLADALRFQDERMSKLMIDTIRQVLTEGDEGTKKLLIQKIPLLCVDVLKIKSDIQWIKWFILGIAGGIGGLVILFLAK